MRAKPCCKPLVRKGWATGYCEARVKKFRNPERADLMLVHPTLFRSTAAGVRPFNRSVIWAVVRWIGITRVTHMVVFWKVATMMSHQFEFWTDLAMSVPPTPRRERVGPELGFLLMVKDEAVPRLACSSSLG